MGRAPRPVGRDRLLRRRYVEELRRHVRAGTYRVDAASVADAMLSRTRRER